MIVTWERYCKRRRISLSDLVQGHGLDYDKLCAFFRARGATVPDRSDPAVVAVFGFPETKKVKKNPIPKAPSISEVKPKVVKQIEVSIKNTKVELLEVALKLKLDANDKLTKASILEVLSASPKILIKQISTGRRKASPKKK